MATNIHPHVAGRLIERGATTADVIETVSRGVRIPAKLGRAGFRQDFAFEGLWRGRYYTTKQVEAYAVMEDGDWLVITVIVKFF